MKAKVILAILVITIFVAVTLLNVRNNVVSKAEFVQQYSIDEQARLGIDCSVAQKEIGKFLVDEVEPLVKQKYSGRALTPQMEHELEMMGDYIFNCARLYRIGEGGQLNGLASLDFVETIIDDYTIVSTLLSEHVSSETCNQRCMEEKKHLLNQSFQKVLNEVRFPVSAKK